MDQINEEVESKDSEKIKYIMHKLTTGNKENQDKRTQRKKSGSL